MRVAVGLPGRLRGPPISNRLSQNRLPALPATVFVTNKRRHPERVARKALELDEALPEAHAALAYVSAYYDCDWATAEREFQRALELNPNDAEVAFWQREGMLTKRWSK